MVWNIIEYIVIFLIWFQLDLDPESNNNWIVLKNLIICSNISKIQ